MEDVLLTLRPLQLETSDAKAAVVQGTLEVHHHIQIQFLQRPVVGLGNKLSRGCDVGLRRKQAPKPDVERLVRKKKTMSDVFL